MYVYTHMICTYMYIYIYTHTRSNGKTAKHEKINCKTRNGQSGHDNRPKVEAARGVARGHVLQEGAPRTA